MLEGYTKRLKGIVSPRFRDVNIGFVGVGAGSYAVEMMARFCPAKIKMMDFDTVELSNLSRTAYQFSDAANERLKVYSLQERIAQINPLVEAEAYNWDVIESDQDDLDWFFTDLDLIVAGTDQLSAQAVVNINAVQMGIPAVFIGLHAGAQGGRIIWYLPGITPCYRCVARDRFEAAEANLEVDLAAAEGCLVDAQMVDIIAIKVALAILERGQDSKMGRYFAGMGRRNEIVVRCDPEYPWGNELWRAVLNDLPKQPRDYGAELQEKVLYAGDSLWFETERDPDCPLCGTRR